MSDIEKILNLIKENPDLPIVPMVDSEVVAEDYGYWMGKWGNCQITEYYCGRERVHFKDDDEENVLMDLCDSDWCIVVEEGTDIYDLSDEDWDKLYQGVPWTKGIVVYITI